MWSRFQSMFFTQPQSKPNKLKLRLDSFLIKYENDSVSVSGSGMNVNVDEHACDKIKERIDSAVGSPKSNPKISMHLILSGHWNGENINMEFYDLDTVQKYLLDNSMLSQSVKECKMTQTFI